MGARTGAQYLQGLRDHPAEVWLGNERIADVTTHPALAHGAKSVARLYDLQHESLEEMTYVSPSSGERVGLSHIQPRSREDIERRSRMMLRWAHRSGGMLGRSPDYLNCNIAAAGAAASYFAQNDPRFGSNASSYYLHVREHDLTLTHTLINPQQNRALGPDRASAEVGARIVEANAQGIVVSGARILATLGPLADEILVAPSTR